MGFETRFSCQSLSRLTPRHDVFGEDVECIAVVDQLAIENNVGYGEPDRLPPAVSSRGIVATVTPSTITLNCLCGS